MFGVDPRGALIGQTVSDHTVEQIVAEFGRIEPAVYPEIERVALDQTGGAIVIASVGRSYRRPHTYKGRAFRRVGNTTHELSQTEYQELLIDARHAQRRWENEVAEDWAVARLDHSEIARTVDEAVRRGRLEEPGTRNPIEMLRGLGLMADGQLLRAAVVLVARDGELAAEYPQCRIRLARFRGTDKTEFIDNRQSFGNAFDLLLQADRFLRAHLPVAGRVVAGVFERSDDPIYPLIALREALANALCHRDYSIGGGSVGVGIYDDRLEITSSGGLHFGLTADDLYEPHDSKPWNPTIADVFYRRGIIEAWGRGTVKMTELMQQAGLPRPEFEDGGGTLLVRFRPSGYLPPQRVGRNLSERQQNVLRVLAEGRSMALGAIVGKLGLSVEDRSVQSDLQLLRSLGLVDTTGWGRGARWHLRNDDPGNG